MSSLDPIRTHGYGKTPVRPNFQPLKQSKPNDSGDQDLKEQTKTSDPVTNYGWSARERVYRSSRNSFRDQEKCSPPSGFKNGSGNEHDKERSKEGGYDSQTRRFLRDEDDWIEDETLPLDQSPQQKIKQDSLIHPPHQERVVLSCSIGLPQTTRSLWDKKVFQKELKELGFLESESATLDVLINAYCQSLFETCLTPSLKGSVVKLLEKTMQTYYSKVDGLAQFSSKGDLTREQIFIIRNLLRTNGLSIIRNEKVSSFLSFLKIEQERIGKENFKKVYSDSIREILRKFHIKQSLNNKNNLQRKPLSEKVRDFEENVSLIDFLQCIFESKKFYSLSSLLEGELSPKELACLHSYENYKDQFEEQFFEGQNQLESITDTIEKLEKGFNFLSRLYQKQQEAREREEKESSEKDELEKQSDTLSDPSGLDPKNLLLLEQQLLKLKLEKQTLMLSIENIKSIRESITFIYKEKLFFIKGYDTLLSPKLFSREKSNDTKHSEIFELCRGVVKFVEEIHHLGQKLTGTQEETESVHDETESEEYSEELLAYEF